MATTQLVATHGTSNVLLCNGRALEEALYIVCRADVKGQGLGVMFRPVTNSRQVLERFEVTSVYQCRVPRWLRRKVVVTHSKNCSFLSPFPLSLIACNRAGQGSSTGNVLRR